MPYEIDTAIEESKRDAIGKPPESGARIVRNQAVRDRFSRRSVTRTYPISFRPVGRDAKLLNGSPCFP